MLEYEWIESQKKWRCYDKKWNWIHFSGFGKTKSEAELNFHLNCTKIAKSNWNMTAATSSSTQKR